MTLDCKKLIELEVKKDVEGIIFYLESFEKNINASINVLFYMWWFLLEPDFNLSLDKKLQEKVQDNLISNFSISSNLFYSDPTFNYILGYCVQLSSWYFFNINSNFNSNDGDKFGREMISRAQLFDFNNPLNNIFYQDLSIEKNMLIADAYISDIKMGKNNLICNGTILSDYIIGIYRNRKRHM